MTKIFAVFLIVVLTNLFAAFLLPELFAQNLLRNPESVVYDSVYNRYLVSNWANGNIIQIDSNGVQDYFVEGHGSINGVAIADGIVFAGCSTKVKGFELSSRDTLMDLAIPGAININDVTSDNAGYIYLTDFDARKIYKVHIQSQSYSTFVSGLSRSPNGIIYEEENNRLLVCTFGTNSPILCISLDDSTVSIVTYTNLTDCDGFAKDDYGNYYISSWATRSVHKYDSNFTNPPELFYHNSSAPVDISYNSVDEILAVPIMFANSIVLLPVNPVSVNDNMDGALQKFQLYQNYPNPFNPATQIQYSLIEPSKVKLTIYDTLGREIKTLVDKYSLSGTFNILWDGKDDSNKNIGTGVYLYQLTNSTSSITKKMILLK